MCAVAVKLSPLPCPTQFDGFEVLWPLGAGGMGSVHLARDRALDRLVAIKLIAPTSDPRVLERFTREARAGARIHHPNVAAVYRTGEIDGQPYVAHEHVAGRRLDELPTPARWRCALGVGLGLARGLAAAHDAGVLHRDVTPANVMISDQGVVKLIDFGLAQLDGVSPPCARGSGDGVRSPRLTADDVIIGTPIYLAPERWSGAPATARGEIHALGLIIYERLVGELPHARMTIQQMGRALRRTDLPRISEQRPSVPLRLARLVDACVRRRPEDRPATVAEVRDELEAMTTASRNAVDAAMLAYVDATATAMVHQAAPRPLQLVGTTTGPTLVRARR